MEPQKTTKKWRHRNVAIRNDLYTLVQKAIAQKSNNQNKSLLPYNFRTVSAFVAEATRIQLLEITKTTPITTED